MATQSLTSYDRSNIRNRILKHRYDRVKEELILREHALARKVYDLAYTEAERAFMESAPEGALEVDGRIGIANVNEDGVQVGYKYGILSFAEPVRVFASRYQSPFLIVSSTKLGKDLQEYFDDFKQYTNDRKSQYDKLDNALKNYRTASTLIRDWPEIKTFVEEVLGKKTLPVVTDFSKFNSVLDLPPETVQ